MTDLNGAPPESPTGPTAASNLRQGLTGSPASKLKLIVVGVIIVGVVAVASLINGKKSDANQPAGETSKVAVAEIALEEDVPAAAAANPEVDSLIAQVESAKQKNAIETGDTYVAPAPDLDSAPTAPPRVQEAPLPAVVTVSYSSQQAKLTALQMLDERLSSNKAGSPTEVQFQVAKESSITTTNAVASLGSSSAAAAMGPSTADQMPSVKQYPAGTRWFATTLTAIDSEVQGPISARIEQGPFAGGEALGSYEITGRKYVTMSFSRIVYKGTEIPISGVGLNPNNGVAGIEGDVNNHWGERLILPTLAAAVGKYAEAATFGGVTSVTAGGSVVQQPELTDKEKLTYALGSGVSQGVTPVIQEEASSIKRQVTLPQYTSFALMLAEGI